MLDFGVAHVTAADLLTTASRTQTGQLLGTLSYMSPEQIAADPAGLDGRSDVYTLGVILFELLAHRLPYHLDQLPVHEVARVIRAAGTVAAGLDRHALPRRRRDHRGQGARERQERGATPRRVTWRRTSGATCAGKRFWPGLPRRSYQLRKFARRHKALVAGASGIFAALLVGTAVSILFALRRERSRGGRERSRGDRTRSASPLIESYRARIAAAVAAISHHDVADAARQLGAAPEALRDWEWRHLHARLDDSIAVFPAIAGEPQFLIRDANGIRIARLTRDQSAHRRPRRERTLARSFGPETNVMYHPPLPTRHGLRLFASVRRDSSSEPRDHT